MNSVKLVPGSPGTSRLIHRTLGHEAVKILTLPLALVCLLLVSGCAYQRAASVSKQYADRGNSVNIVTLTADGDVITFGRLVGTPQREIELLTPIRQVRSTSGVTVRISEPEDVGLRGLASHQVVGQGFGNFSAAMEKTLSRYQQAIGPDASLDIVLVNRDVGAYRGVRSDSGSPLSLSFLFHAPDPTMAGERAIVSWWAAVLENVAHELFHVHMRMGRTQVESDFPLIDEEAAASINGTCGLMDAALSWSELPTIDHSTAAEPFRGLSAFPGLSQRRFEPDMSVLQQVEGLSVQGRLLGTAVLFSKLPDGVLDVADAESRELVFEYCSELLHHVPAFTAGEV